MSDQAHTEASKDRAEHAPKDSGACFASEVWINAKDLKQPQGTAGSGDFSSAVIKAKENVWIMTDIYKKDGEKLAHQGLVHDKNWTAAMTEIFEDQQKGDKGKYYRIDGNQPQFGDNGKPATAGSSVAEITPNPNGGDNGVREIKHGSKEFNKVQELGVKYFAANLARCADK